MRFRRNIMRSSTRSALVIAWVRRCDLVTWVSRGPVAMHRRGVQDILAAAERGVIAFRRRSATRSLNPPTRVVAGLSGPC